MLTEHHRSIYRYLARQYSAGWQLPLRVLLAAGLTGRLAFALLIRRVREGARPTRGAEVLRG
jgi:N-acetylglucosaminyl-diphospho-decaprenol L-rhamnosyltransferase